MLDDDLFELFVVAVEGTDDFASFFGANVNLIAADLAIVFLVDVSQVVDIFGPAVSFLQSF